MAMCHLSGPGTAPTKKGNSIARGTPRLWPSPRLWCSPRLLGLRGSAWPPTSLCGRRVFFHYVCGDIDFWCLPGMLFALRLRWNWLFWRLVVFGNFFALRLQWNWLFCWLVSFLVFAPILPLNWLFWQIRQPCWSWSRLLATSKSYFFYLRLQRTCLFWWFAIFCTFT